MMFRKNSRNPDKINPNTPKWFLEWLLNDFTHLQGDIWWLKLFAITGITAIIGSIIAYLFKG